MPRKLISRYLPNPESVKNNRFLKVFGHLIHDPQLWHLTRYSVSHAFLVGLFCAWIPVPFQMILAAGGAIMFSANLPLSVALVWITNPFTIPFLFGFSYLVGAWTLGMESGGKEFVWAWSWANFNTILTPFLLGCAICGLVSAAIGYAATRLFWRLHIVNAWQHRKQKRRLRASR